ncbi:Uncharacterised protein [Burkholderia pseudomallei]|nr:Uncharacterised protein [Burkholderia pseudomallei]
MWPDVARRAIRALLAEPNAIRRSRAAAPRNAARTSRRPFPAPAGCARRVLRSPAAHDERIAFGSASNARIARRAASGHMDRFARLDRREARHRMGANQRASGKPPAGDLRCARAHLARSLRSSHGVRAAHRGAAAHDERIAFGSASNARIARRATSGHVDRFARLDRREARHRVGTNQRASRKPPANDLRCARAHRRSFAGGLRLARWFVPTRCRASRRSS